MDTHEYGSEIFAFLILCCGWFIGWLAINGRIAARHDGSLVGLWLYRLQQKGVLKRIGIGIALFLGLCFVAPGLLIALHAPEWTFSLLVLVGVLLVVAGLIWLLRIHRRRRAARFGRTLIGWWFYQLKEKRIADLKAQGYTDEQIATKHDELKKHIEGLSKPVLIVGGFILLLIITFTAPISVPVLVIWWYKFFRQSTLFNKQS